MNHHSAPSALLEGPGRCQLAFTAPFALFAGGLYGAAAARLTRTPAEIGVPLGAIAFLLFAAIQIGSGPWAAERFCGEDGRWGSVASYDPKDVEAYLGLASIQHRFLHDSDGAILTLRTALRQATMTEGHTIVAFQRMAAIRGEQTRPEALAPDLARYLDKKSRGPAADWARANLTRIKGGVHEEGSEGGRAGTDRGAASDA